jgi:intracellular sulfur oxidation DsrE/DsrF family protein
MKLLMTLVMAALLNTGVLYADSAKVVYDLSTGEPNKIENKLIKSITALAKYYASEKKSLKVIVVISGDAYKYFIDDLKVSPYASDKEAVGLQKKFKPLLENLNDLYGVTFYMCSSGMKARQIERDTLYKYVNADMMKSVYLIDAQNNGYAYMPIH